MFLSVLSLNRLGLGFRTKRVDREGSGELEAGVSVDGVAELLAQSGLPRIVGQFEQIKAGGRCGQTGRALFVARRAHVKEAFDHCAKRVARVLCATYVRFFRNLIFILYQVKTHILNYQTKANNVETGELT